MTLPLFHQTPLQEAFAALRRDLIQEDGPRISTMRNYRFAIVQYQPADEFKAFLATERPLAMDEKAQALLDGEARARLARLSAILACMPWTNADLEASIRAFAEAEGVKLGKVAQPLRAAITGSASSPPVFDVLVALGRDESLGRIGDQTA